MPLLLHLLSPASRPVQVTRDLASSGPPATARCAPTCAANIPSITGRTTRSRPSRPTAPRNAWARLTD
ncbi:MAG: ATP-dependent helicase C-terminal domain-containing protein [Pseudomonadota bacterium]